MAETHWFEAVADHLGAAYLRYAFTKNTVREVDVLETLLDLAPGSTVLDVGCGPGRHSLELASRGHRVVGVDISARFVELATTAAAAAGLGERATFRRLDARDLDVHAEFDAAIAMCQGAFGLQGGPAAAGDPGGLAGDEAILAGISRALRPGGRVALAAFNAYFQVRHLDEANTFDPDTGVHHEVTEIRDESGDATTTDLWTTCFTPRELRLMAARAGLDVLAVHGAHSGERFGADPVSIDEPEILVVATPADR